MITDELRTAVGVLPTAEALAKILFYKNDYFFLAEFLTASFKTARGFFGSDCTLITENPKSDPKIVRS